MYHELVWVNGSHEGAMRVVILSLRAWEIQYETMMADFLVAFPDVDPQLCIASLCYIRDHQNEMQASLKTGSVDIRVTDVERFGLRKRLEETVGRKDGGVGPGVDFILDQDVAN